MYIARLQLKSFKSFGGAHDLPLSPGMTAIVGPNGSGKSNLLDALRWVLGDSHASKLRITRQGDLLFQGSASRAMAVEAEVAIQLRDDVRVTTIRRRVSDSGAQILVDGSRVTLAELDSVKRLWQLGGDRFAFIGQGDVTEVIQQRPAARRALLESLFGIDAYRKRREEAASRLAEAREEYVRLRTFSAELSARKEEIAPLVERAREAREILDALEEGRSRLYWARRSRLEVSQEEAAAEIGRVAAEFAMREAWARRWRQGVDRRNAKLDALSRARSDQVRALEETRSSLLDLTRSAYSRGTVLTDAGRRRQRAARERETLDGKLRRLRSERDALSAENAAARSELEEAKSIMGDSVRRLEAQKEAARAEREARENLARERGELEGEISTRKGRARSLSMSLRELEERRAMPDAMGEIKAALGELEHRSEGLLAARDEALETHRDLYARLQQVTSELGSNRREASKLDRRLEELREAARTEIYPRPVSHLLSAGKLKRLDAAPVPVIDAFSVPVELASAMEAFLGGRQFWMLVETMDEAGRCIEQLKKNQMGRATFLPLERCNTRRPDAWNLPPRAVGWAMDLIEPVAKWRPALLHLMGDLLIVEDYATGMGMVKDGFRRPIATLEGDVFATGGTVSGGKAQKSGRAIETRNALVQLEREARTRAAAVASLAEEYARLEAQEAEAAEKKEALSREIRAVSEERSALHARREAMAQERTRARSERDRLRDELKRLGREYASLCERLRNLATLENETTPEVDVNLTLEAESAKGRVALAEERLRSIFALSERANADMAEAKRESEALDQSVEECEREIMESRATLKRLAKRYAELARRKREIMRVLEESVERYGELERAARARENRAELASYACEASREASRDAEVRADDVRRELAELIATWEEQYPYPGESSAGDDPDELRRGIRERDRALKALGEVDMGALSEDRSLRDRLAFLGEQLDDVRTSMAELERMIASADEQARGVFTGALEEIDGKFGALFKRLFGGGEARLQMIEGESLWDSGVEVVARPPGKHPQGIAQLSGGEQSLSAIALLFSSLEVANCPIAVLDEVDAALDEVNLRRFADLAREASAERQIFVMTHRRLTMERADVLYGVTLAEPGLSQVIGVRTEDWN